MSLLKVASTASIHSFVFFPVPFEDGLEEDSLLPLESDFFESLLDSLDGELEAESDAFLSASALFLYESLR